MIKFDIDVIAFLKLINDIDDITIITIMMTLFF